jgi:adenosylcobinamide-GDP ribazoletransferase
VNNFLIALQFLTRFPVNFNIDWQERKVAASLLWYPLVGALIGCVLVLLAFLLAGRVDVMLTAVLLLSVWVIITGGLHLDGLADTADAWVGSHGDKQRALAIMKDPQAGPVAVIVLVLILLIKFAALHSLVKHSEYLLIILPVIFARCVPLLLFLTTPYIREQGLGSAMAKYMPRQLALLVLFFCALLLIMVFGFSQFFLLTAIMLLVLWLLRFLMLKNIGGMTGDTIGAAIEITETVVLCALVFINS